MPDSVARTRAFVSPCSTTILPVESESGASTDCSVIQCRFDALPLIGLLNETTMSSPTAAVDNATLIVGAVSQFAALCRSRPSDEDSEN